MKALFRCWVILFGLVGAQMSWVLRPFVGDPGRPFARGSEARESNFFEAVWAALVSLFSAKDLLRRADAVLRGVHPVGPWTLIVLCGLVYGGVMGAFGGLFWQVVYSAVKVPLLLLATPAAQRLPSYLVVNTLLGVRADFAEALRAIAASQATVTIVLVALAPLTLLWYASSTAYHAAILFNAAMLRCGEPGRPDRPGSRLPPPDRLVAATSLAALDLDRAVRLRGNPDGLDVAAIHRLAERPGAVFFGVGTGRTPTSSLPGWFSIWGRVELNLTL